MEPVASQSPQGTELLRPTAENERSNTTGQAGTVQERDLKQSSYVCNSSKRTRKPRLTRFFVFVLLFVVVGFF